MKVKKAVIPAAGLGTRFLPATKAQPKEMLPIVDKPTIQYIVEEAVRSGIEQILIITGRSKRAVEDHFDRSPELEQELLSKDKEDLLDVVRSISSMAEIYYVRQKQPKGLGHAVLCAKAFIGNEPFAVMLGDDVVYSEVPVVRQLMDVYDSHPGTILGVQSVPYDQTNKYGIVRCKKEISRGLYSVEDLVEKPKIDPPSNIAILGRYIITPEVFDILETTAPGAGGEIQLTDALRTLAGKQAMYAFEFEGKRYDVGDRMGFLKATVEFALRRPDLNKEFARFLKELEVDSFL
ncbi:MAG: UTP--glucose-1-phosphate uridylyltransferase GalU [Christensenellales bacterium]